MKWLPVLVLVSTPALAQDYTIAPTAPGLENIQQTGTPLYLGDDHTAKVSLGFSFDYYGQSFTDAWVGSNGFLSFNSAAHLCCDGRIMSQAPRNTIYGAWTDLLSWDNPYIRRDTLSSGDLEFIAGWYSSYEYGTNNSNTFEISLRSDNSIQLNYGNINVLHHYLSAGLTGPTKDDNQQLYFGFGDTGFFDGKSFAINQPAALDCSKTPFIPECVRPVEQATEEAAVSTTTEPTTAQQEQTVEEPVASVATVTQAASPASSQENSTSEPVAESRSDKTENSVSAPVAEVKRDVAALPETTSQETVAPSEVQETVALNEAQNDETSPESPAAVLDALELLDATTGAEKAEDAGQDTDQGETAASDLGADDSTAETLSAPSLSQYAQSNLPDAPFYPVEDFYQSNQITDANMALYQMRRGDDATFDRLIGGQYGR